MSAPVTGRCLCGEVTFVGRGSLGDMHVCHCRSCARWNGGPAFALSFSEGVEITGPVTWFSSSDWAERGFCSKCGSSIFYRLKSGDLLSVSTGSLDDQTIVPPVSSHIYVDTKPAYYEFTDSAPRLTEEEFLASLNEEK